MEGPLACCGCSVPEVQYVSAAEVAVQCGPGLLLLKLDTAKQRVLGSSGWTGIQSFAASAKGGVLAVALKGYQPAIHIFSIHDLQQQARFAAGASFGYTAVALSHDGELLAVCADRPEQELSVWHWRQGLKLASAKLPAPVSKISFHPADSSALLTTTALPAPSPDLGADSTDPEQAAGSTVLLWQLHKLWEQHELQSTPLQLPSSAGWPTCHAWAPEGVYVGCSDGSITCINAETGAAISRALPQAVAAAGGSSSTTPSVSSIALNKHWLAVAGSNTPNLVFFQRCATHSGSLQQSGELQPLGSIQVSSVGCGAVAFGGPAHASLVASTLDGSLLLLSPGGHFDPAQPDPASLQVEPLADWHVGAVTGVAAAASGAHLISCGLDGSLQVWAAAAGGQLVSKRDVGGQLTCCASWAGPEASSLAVGSRAGVLRLVNTSDLGSLPVVHHSRLFRGPVTHVAFSPCGVYLAVAAAATGRVALLKVAAAGQQVQLLGFVNAEGSILSLCWLQQSSHQQPSLLASLSNSKLLLLSPPVRPAHVRPAQLTAAHPTACADSDAAADACVLDLSHADVHAAVLSAPAPLTTLTVLTHDASSSNSSSSSGLQVLGGSCDGQLFWLQLPSAAASVHQSRAAPQQAAVAAKALLPWPAAALTVSPSGREVLAAADSGAMLLLPTAPAAAAAVLISTEPATVAGASAVMSGDAAVPGRVLAWSADASWAASAGADGSLLVYATGVGGHGLGGTAAAALPAPAALVPQDCDVPDDSQAPTVPEAEAARVGQEARAAAESVRAATIQRLADLKQRLQQVLAANTAAPADQQLSGAELVVNSQLLQQQRSSVAAEEAELLSRAPRSSMEQEVQAKRLKALCWDAYQVKRAVCTGLKADDPQVWNFQLTAQDEAGWAQVAEQRREQLLAANKHILDQDAYARSAASSTLADTALTATSTGSGNGADAAVPGAHGSDPGIPAVVPVASMGTVTDGVAGSSSSSQQAAEHLALLTRVKACSDARKCSPSDLLLTELGVTTPEDKLMQAAIYRRMVWELKSQFNKEFEDLVKQKHTDADRLSDLNTRVDKLIRELVKIHLVLNPAAAAAAADNASAAGGADLPAAGGRSSTAGAAAAGGGGGGSGVSTAREGAADGRGDVASAAQLAADLGAGRLVPYWSPEETLEEMLLKIQPGEVKASKYLTPAERAKADAEAAAAEAARRAAAADSSRTRALQQMMGGRLERSVDEVSELVTSRPSWMVGGDPSTFNEEQLREYREYSAREAAAIEERLKRKGMMETELRTLKAAAEEVAGKFDAAVAALAAKRLDVLAEVTALETRVLQLQADEEVAAVTAGPEAQAAAAHALQQAQTALTAVERELAVTQHLHDQQQEALAALHAEEKATDRVFKRDFGHVDPLVLPHLSAMYKTRIYPVNNSPAGSGLAGQHSTTTAAGTAAAPVTQSSGRVGSASRGSVGPSPRALRGGQPAASPRASKTGAVGQLASPGGRQGQGAASQGAADSVSASAELAFTPLSLKPGHRPGSAAAAAAAGGVGGASGSGAQQHGRAGGLTAAQQQELSGPLGLPEIKVVQLGEGQMPEGVDDDLWLRFLELHAARAQLDLVVREQTAKVLCLRRQLQLLLVRHAEASEAGAAAAGALDELQKRQHSALHDVEVQLRLKQGQVEVWPSGLASIAPEALLVGRQEVKHLNKVILSKGEAKLEMLRKMKEFKRGIHQLHWENRKCEMEAEDVIRVTQQLQLLHVTQEFQQQVKAGATNSGSSSGSSGNGRPGSDGQAPGRASAAGAAAAAAAAAAGSSAAAAGKEVASLENLLKMREALHGNAVEQKKRQLRSVEAQLAAKRNENATLALHLAGLERLLDEAARLRSSTAADDAEAAADRKARSLAMQAKLRDIAEAQAAEIAAAEGELRAWQARCFPCLPALPGEDDQQLSGGADQAGSPHCRDGKGSCTLPEIKGAQAAGLGALGQSAGGFVPHGARASAGRVQGSLPAAIGGLFGEQKNKRTYVGPDGKPGLLGRG